MFMTSFIKPLTLGIDMKDLFCPTGGWRNRLIRILGIMVRKPVSATKDLRVCGISNGQRTDLNVGGLAKGGKQSLTREFWKQDLEGVVDEEPMDAVPRITI